MSEFTFPSSTIFATSTVSGSDTRRPSTNRTSIPSRSMYAVMSGPPPWTTIGFSPTYLSSTMSVANASRSSSSRIAAPPYLTTIVRPWNSRMYGSASSRISTLALTRSPHSRRVLRVDPHVLGGEVGEVHVRGRIAAAERDPQLDLGVLRAQLAGDDRLGAELLELLPRERHPRRLRHPSPVGIAAVQRRLHQRRVRDRARDAIGLAVVRGALDRHPGDPARPLAVGDDLDGELQHHGAEQPVGERLAGRPGRLEEHRVVGAHLPVDRDAL